MLADRYTDGHYLEVNPDWHGAHAPWKASQIMRLFHEAGVWPQSICDVGCGTGGVLHALAESFVDSLLVGYEPSPQAVALEPSMDDRVELVIGDFRRDSRRFDLVMAIDVFEHVEDYIGFLRDLHLKAPKAVFHIPLDLSVYTVLRDERTLMRARTDLGHLHHFTRATAIATLRHAGWEPRTVRVTRGIFEHNQLPTMVRKLRWAPVAALARISEAAAAKVAGGFNLLILAEDINPSSSEPYGSLARAGLGAADDVTTRISC